MQPVVRAIDVGFGYTKFVTHVEGTAITCNHFPSIAAASVSDPAGRAWGGRRKTVAVRVGELFYEAGPDIDLALGNFRPQLLRTDDYLNTAEYLALMRAAMDFMQLDTIDLLVVGLPVALFSAKKSALERLAAGEHSVSNGRIVRVKKALAVAQPQGALVSFASSEGKMDRLRQYESLIIDAGSRTFDWLVTRGMRLVTSRSNSVNRGVHNVLSTIANEIGIDIGEPFQDLDALDLALRKIRPLMLWGKPYSVEKYRPLVAPIAYDAVQSMLGSIGHRNRFECIVVAGGGSYLFKKAIREAFPQYRLEEVSEPMYANVRGYQVAGQAKVGPKADVAPANEGVTGAGTGAVA
jgi:plasmid segregation protein ParM